jgi:hypothetical protein
LNCNRIFLLKSIIYFIYSFLSSGSTLFNLIKANLILIEVKHLSNILIIMSVTDVQRSRHFEFDIGLFLR